MPKHPLFLLFFISIYWLSSQEPLLPPDFRQYNLTQFNSSLFNPVFSLDRNNPQSLSLWVRWQWQQVDADPTTIFANYSHKLNRRSAFGVGFIQQNTGSYLQTGGVLNYAHSFEITTDFSVALGINTFGFKQDIADDLLLQGPNTGLPPDYDGSTFIIQAVPGIQLTYKDLSLGLAVENGIQYDTSAGKQVTGSDQKIFLGSAGYSIHIREQGIFENAFVRPSFYLKTIPGFDSQFGVNSLFSAGNYWVQGGYNNFYGLSGGLGATFFQKLSIGVLVEVSNSKELTGKDPTFELITSYQFKAPDNRRKIVGFEVEEELAEDMLVADQEKEVSRKERRDVMTALGERVQDSLEGVQRQRDSVALARRIALEEENARRVMEAQRKRDSIAALVVREEEIVDKEEVIVPEAGERYEEAALSDEIAPGFYLIVNAFGTQRYLKLFMESLTKKGLHPKSFYREERKLNYVYLERYNTISEARKARDSKFFGKYTDTIWIFRVRD